MTEVGRVGASCSCFLKPPRMAAAMARVRPARTVTDKLFAYLSYQDARKRWTGSAQSVFSRSSEANSATTML